jgi:CheY-like chemotaxis protein
LRSDTEYCLLPVVLLTESVDAKIQEGRRAGAAAMILKPFNIQQILKTVQSVVSIGNDVRH